MSLPKKGNYITQIKIPAEGWLWLSNRAQELYSTKMGLVRILLAQEIEAGVDFGNLPDLTEMEGVIFQVQVPWEMVGHIGGKEQTAHAIRFVLLKKAGIIPDENASNPAHAFQLVA